LTDSVDKKVHVDKENISTNELIQSWKGTDLKLNEAAPIELIIDTQQKLDFTFPNDFINFYKQVNGFNDWDVIGEMFSIWPLERIADEYGKSNDKDFIPFCDYLINSHWIGYFKSKEGVFKDYDAFNPISKSFDETIRLICANSELLY